MAKIEFPTYRAFGFALVTISAGDRVTGRLSLASTAQQTSSPKWLALRALLYTPTKGEFATYFAMEAV